jgi:hypothetical protein
MWSRTPWRRLAGRSDSVTSPPRCTLHRSSLSRREPASRPHLDRHAFAVIESFMSWTCPRCHRAFRQVNQRHACGVGSPGTLLKNRPPALAELYRKLETTVKDFGGVEVVTRDRYALFRTTRRSVQSRGERRVRRVIRLNRHIHATPTTAVPPRAPVCTRGLVGSERSGIQGRRQAPAAGEEDHHKSPLRLVWPLDHHRPFPRTIVINQ